MKKITFLFIHISILSFTLIEVCYSQQALVRSYTNNSLEIGQAYLTHYGEQCLAILPTHVVAESGPIASFLREGVPLILGETTQFYDLGGDISVAILSGAIVNSCGFSSVTVSRAIDSRINANAISILRTVNSDSTIAQLSLSIIDNDGSNFLRVQPINDSNQLRKGQSGSMLMAAGIAVGMLVSVDARFGIGTVIRLDSIFDKVDDFISTHTALAADTTTNQAAHVISKNGTVTSWTAMAIDDRHRAVNLLATDDSPHWQATVTQWPVEIEFSLRERTAIAGFKLDVSGIERLGTLPDRIEILVSSIENGKRWRSSIGGQVTYTDESASFTIAPTWARHIKLVINNTVDSSNSVSLRRFRIFSE